MKNNLLILIAIFITPYNSGAAETDFIPLMERMQDLTQQLAQATAQKDLPQAERYSHELRQVINAATLFENHNNYPVGELVKARLLPHVIQLENSLNRGLMAQTSKALDQLIDGCNSCHNITGYSFIVISKEPGKTGPPSYYR